MILCLENSSHKDIFFAGGSTNYDLKSGTAEIFAVTFNEELNLITSRTLNSSLGKSMGVTCIKKMDQGDTLFLGTNRSLFVVEFTGMKFEILKVVENLHSCNSFFEISFSDDQLR